MHPEMAGQRPLAADHAEIIRLCGKNDNSRSEENQDESQPAHGYNISTPALFCKAFER
jgi:hypothetical protein